RIVPIAASAAAPAASSAAAAATTTTVPLPRRRGGTGRASSAAASARRSTSGEAVGRAVSVSASLVSSADIALLVLDPQLLERARQARVHRADGHVERLGDRRRRQPEPVAEDDDDAPLKRQRRDRLEQRPVPRGDVRPRFAPLDLADQPPLSPEQVEGAIDDDPVQPRRERPPLVEAGQGRERALEG